MPTIQERRAEIAAELGLPIDKVTVCPYRVPKEYPSGPTQWENSARQMLDSAAKQYPCRQCDVTVYYHHGCYCGQDFYDNTNAKNPDIIRIVRRNIGGLQREQNT